eukprot:Nk52_evm20s316 gene=Nk52_evmTU20s316
MNLLAKCFVFCLGVAAVLTVLTCHVNGCVVDIIQKGDSQAMNGNSFISYDGLGRWECLPRKQFVYDPLVQEFQLSVEPQCSDGAGCFTVRCVHVIDSLDAGRYVFALRLPYVSGGGGTARAYTSIHGQNIEVHEHVLNSAGDHFLFFDFEEEKNLLKLEIEIYKGQTSKCFISQLALVQVMDDAFSFSDLCHSTYTFPSATSSAVLTTTNSDARTTTTSSNVVTTTTSDVRITKTSSNVPTTLSSTQSSASEPSSSTQPITSTGTKVTSAPLPTSSLSTSPLPSGSDSECATNFVLNDNFTTGDDGWYCDGSYETGYVSGVLLQSSGISSKCKQIICLEQNILYKFEFTVEIDAAISGGYAEVRVQDVGEPKLSNDHAAFAHLTQSGAHSTEFMLSGTSSGIQILLFVAKGSTLKAVFKNLRLYPASNASKQICSGNGNTVDRVTICRLNILCSSCNEPEGGFCQRGVCLCKPTHSGDGCFTRKDSSVFFDDFSSGPLRWLKGCKQWGGWALDITDPLYENASDKSAFSRINGGVVPPNIQLSQWEGETKRTLKIQSHGDYYQGSLIGLDEKACSIRSGENERDFQRVGGAIVSKDYFASGSYEVRMKMNSVLGAVTTMWTFWYGEYYYDGNKSERELYETHCQKYCMLKDNTPCDCNIADGVTCIDMCPGCQGEYPCKQNGFDTSGNLQTFKAYWVRNHEVDIELPTAKMYSRDGREKSGLKYTSGHSLSNTRFNTWQGEIMGYEEMNNFMDIGLDAGDGEYHTFRFDWHTGGHSPVTGRSEEARVEFFIDSDLKTVIYNDRKEYYTSGLLRTIRYQRIQTWANQDELEVGGTVLHVHHRSMPHPDTNGWPNICQEQLCTLDWDKWTSHKTGPVIPTIAGKFWIAVWFPTVWGGYPGFSETHTVVDWVKITPFLEENDEYVPESYPLAETCNSNCPYED